MDRKWRAVWHQWQAYISFCSLKRSCTHAALVNAVENAKTVKSGWWVDPVQEMFAKHNTAAKTKEL